MALGLDTFRDASIFADADDVQVRLAVVEVAGYDSSIGGLRSDVKVVKWMQGVTFAGIVVILFKLSLHGW